jgi:hypothetical protein
MLPSTEQAESAVCIPLYSTMLHCSCSVITRVEYAAGKTIMMPELAGIAPSV